MAKILLFILFSVSILTALENTPDSGIMGYFIEGDSTTFIFNAGLYGKDPQKVVVTGTFRGWDNNMNDQQWQLKKGPNSTWTLRVYNPAFKTIPVKSEFKFRIDDGEWISAATGAPNNNNGNLIFAFDKKAFVLEAEVVSPKNIQLIFKDAVPDTYNYDPSNYILETVTGEKIAIEKIFYIRPTVLQLIPGIEINKSRLHYLTVKDLAKKITVSYDGWFRTTWSSKKLGANFDQQSDKTSIRIFIPRADSVFVFLYKEPRDKPEKVLKMYCDTDGVWEIFLRGNYESWYYDFTAYGPDEPGNHFYQANPLHFTDPWGRVSVDTWGPARIWPEMKPAKPLKKGIPPFQDVIAYEVHVQDFTRLLPVADSLKGTFKGFISGGLTNSRGAKIGFDHLVDLGINVVHLMPVQEYLHYPDDEWQAAFKNDPYMVEQGINLENYQWGYRTSHAFALESRYRVKGSTWGSQNKDFRDLVQAFHDKNIAVIVDLVFNHTAEKMGKLHYFNFAAMDVPYFYRTNDKMDFLGEYGTETKSEERPVMQRWIIEQCTDLINQYGIDGFRIDLAGQTDQQTLTALREALGPDIIVYGEPWIASADPDYENNPDWDWYKADAPISFFQDDTRNAFKGPPSNPQNKQTDRGYAGGNGNREAAKKGLSAGFPEDKTTLSGINYLDIHDNWALADRFATTDWDGRQGVDEIRYKIAATLLFTSLGPIVLHGGSEFMRSKGVAPLVEIVKKTENESVYIHGKRDTYNLARANQFTWENLGKNIGDAADVKCNYQNMNEFWKGLIALRKSHYGRAFRIAEKPAADYYRWVEPENSNLLGYFVNETVFVLLNTSDSAAVIENVEFPAGLWKLIGNNEKVDHLHALTGHKDTILKGSRKHDLHIDGPGLKIWVCDFVN